MKLKQLFVALLLCISAISLAEEPVKFKLYGFARSDFFYNSRLNVDGIDGLFHLFPKPVDMSNGVDKNAKPQAEMISIATRLGLDISGNPIFGAKSSAKIEVDFGGFGTSYYVLRIRHAYAKLNWEKSELMVGQFWHPLFGSIMPTGPSFNAGAPFQPFNRCPQVKYRHSLFGNWSAIGAASYEMQYLSQGPIGSSASYMKNALLPDLYLGFESKSAHWISGVGAGLKTIKPSVNNLTSGTVTAYTQYTDSKWQCRLKTLVGQNLTDYMMPCGYGVTDSIGGEIGYTNFNMSSSWFNLVYGTKWQAGILLGYAKNLGTTQELKPSAGKFTVYGYGVYDQKMLDMMYRIAPHISYNLSNMRFGLEYDFMSAAYGTLKSDGTVQNTSLANNHRVVASVSYIY